MRRISDLDITTLPRSRFDIEKLELPKVMYSEKDLLTQRTELQRELAFEYTDRYDVFLGGITKAILASCAASARFAEVLPKVRAYVEQRGFGKPVDLDNPETVKKLNFLPVREEIRDALTSAILKLQVVTEPYQMTGAFTVSSDTALPHFRGRLSGTEDGIHTTAAHAFVRTRFHDVLGQAEGRDGLYKGVDADAAALFF